MAVLSFGLLSLSTVSLRSVEAERYQSEARANARMALMPALHGWAHRSIGQPAARILSGRLDGNILAAAELVGFLKFC